MDYEDTTGADVPLTYRHGCTEHGIWEDHNQYSVCPKCGGEDLEEISEEEYETIFNRPEPEEVDPALEPADESEEVQP